MKCISLTHRHGPEDVHEANALFCGKFAQDGDFDTVLRSDGGPVDVRKPDGSILCRYRPRALHVDESAYPDLFAVLSRVSTYSDNRGDASGKLMKTTRSSKTGGAGTNRVPPVVYGYFYSSIYGYMDRDSRRNGCRQTAISSQMPETWHLVGALARECAREYEQAAPAEFYAQAAYCANVSPDFLIAGTPYTTITINRNFRTAYHRDAGDLCGEGLGLSNITAFWRGNASGSLLVFPAFRVAVELGTGDFLAMDAHEIHGNTPIAGIPGAFDRFSMVLYVRAKMMECGTAEEELRRIAETADRRVEATIARRT
jgi:hypothetical protein